MVCYCDCADCADCAVADCGRVVGMDLGKIVGNCWVVVGKAVGIGALGFDDLGDAAV